MSGNIRSAQGAENFVDRTKRKSRRRSEKVSRMGGGNLRQPYWSARLKFKEGIWRRLWGEGQQEEIPLVQGKEQRLCLAGAAVKRCPTPKVRETQVRW